MRKMMIMLLGFVLLVSLAACRSGGSGSGGTAPGQGSAVSDTGTAAADTGTTAPGQGKDADAPGKDSPPAKGGKTTITFSTFWPDARFQEAKKKYEALHPDVEIKLTDLPTDNANVEADLEKYATTMNTAMLAGKGPDLLEMKELPVASYVQQKLLVDLDTMMDQDSAFKKEDYFSNILDNAKIGGGLYGLPLSFFLYGFAGDMDAIAQAGVQIDDKSWTWSDFAKATKKLAEDGPYKNVLNSTPEYLLAQMVSDNYSQFVDAASRKANFDSPSFIGLMQQVKGMGDDGIIGEGRPYFYPIQINSPGDYMTSLKGFLAKNMKLLIMPHPEEVAAGGYFMNYLTIGLNAKSQVKEQAWDFLKFMMSDQITTPPNTAGFPINKKAFAAELAQLKDDGSVPTVKEGPLKGVPVKVDNGKLDQLQSFLEGAIHPALFRSDQVAQFVTDESKAFFSGQKSAEDVARLIQNKVTTYLNE